MVGDPQNVQVTVRGDGRIRVEWDFERERHFFYSDASKLDPLPRRSDLVEPCLFAQPLDDQGEPEGRARIMSLKPPSHRRMVEAVKKVVVSQALIERAFEVDAEQRKVAEAEKARQAAEAAFQHRFGTHGPHLLNALQHIAATSQEPEVVAKANEALRLATE